MIISYNIHVYFFHCTRWHHEQLAVDDVEGTAITNLRFADKNIIMEHWFILLQNAALIVLHVFYNGVDFEGRFL